MPQSNLHLDILMGRDELIEPTDVFLGPRPSHLPGSNTADKYYLGMETGPSIDVRKEMEKKYRV